MKCNNAKIIPTPGYIKQTKDNVKNFSRNDCIKVFVTGKRSEKTEFGISFLQRQTGFNITVANEGVPGEKDILIYSGLPLSDSSIMKIEDWDFFTAENAVEQGYILKSKLGQPILLAAQSDMGCLYGLSTLIQLLKENDELYDFTIRDCPDFKYRANKWVIWCETGVLSYDWGDGAEKYKERFIKKLDMALLYKINVIYCDGFGWDADRTPDYAQLNRELCDEARKRGIHLVYGGYTMSYGMSVNYKYSGKVFLNRRSYPDGEIYPCCGQHEVLPSKGRTSGTCLSNKELMRLKMEELTEFVEKVHPGALYLHNTDATNVTQGAWSERCDECRKRWPNDDLNAEDGAAGAYAEFFDEISRCIKSVKSKDYDAAKDCLIIFVSPGYMVYDQTDDETFKVGLEFWKNVDRFMKKGESTFIGHRELFYNRTDNELRCGQIGNTRKNTETCIIYFSGADEYYSDKLFQITSIFNYMFQGTEFILCANGNSYQEPLQLLNAEYMWNSTKSAYFNLDKEKPKNHREFLDIYKKCIKTEFRPDEIYGNEGLLEDACVKLYGKKAGLKMAELYRLKGKNFEPPIMHAANKELGTEMQKLVFEMRWDNILERARILEISERFKEQNRISGDALAIVNSIIEENEYEEETEEDIRWIGASLEMGVRLTGFLVKYMVLFEALDKHFADSTVIDDGILTKCEDLRQEVSDYRKYQKALPLNPIDVMGGAMIRRDEVLEFIEYNLTLMINSIEIDKRMPENRRELPERKWW